MQLTCDLNHAYKTAPRFFPSLQSAVIEMVQNAYRSYWPISPTADPKPRILLDFVYNHDTGRCDIRVTDYGCGIDSPERLLSLNTTRWADDVAGDQDPAGMGAMAPLAHAKEVLWVSTFGALLVDSHEFFNDPAYREALAPNPTPDEPLPAGAKTQVTMRGCDPAAWKQLSRAANQLFSFYRLVDVIVDGRATACRIEAELPVVELPGMRVHACFNYYGYQHLWKPDANNHDSNEYNIVIWHGHVINLGPTLCKVLPDDMVLPSGLKINPRAFAFCIEILGENMVTPQLPDRRFLVGDERTKATVLAAWYAVLPCLEAYLLNLIANPPLGAESFKDKITSDRRGVLNWVSFAHERCKFAIYRANRYKTGGHRGYDAVESVLIKDYEKTYDPSRILVRTPKETQTIDIPTGMPGGLMLDDCDAGSDVLEDAGWFHRSTPNFVCLIDLSDNIPESGPQILPTTTANIYMVPVALVNDDDTVPEDLDLSPFLVLDNVWGSICEKDLGYSTLMKDVIIFNWNLDGVIEAYQEHIVGEYGDRSDYTNDDPYPLDDFDEATARLKAKWANKDLVDLDLDILAHQFNANNKKLTIDFAMMTVEVEGKVTDVTW